MREENAAAVTAKKHPANNIVISGQSAHAGKLVFVVIDTRPAVASILGTVQAPHTINHTNDIHPGRISRAGRCFTQRD